MKNIFSNKRIIICVLVIILMDAVIGYFLLTNRSFPRLAMWHILESHKREDFYWAPQNMPDYFHFEPMGDGLSIFRNEIFPSVKKERDEFKIARAVLKHMSDISVDEPKNNAKFGLPLIWDSPEGILRQLKKGVPANCFYRSILFSAYLSSIGIKSRLWTMEGDDGLDKLSHTATEVYINSLRKWVLIDPLYTVYFTKDKDNSPLSVLELRDECLARGHEKILVHNILGQDIRGSDLFLRKYVQLIEFVFLRAENDFVNRYDARIRYGALRELQIYLDKLPTEWRRGFSYLFGRKDFLVHYVDRYSSSLKLKIILARGFFYFFIVSSIAIFVLFWIAIVEKILRKTPPVINLSKKQTRQR